MNIRRCLRTAERIRLQFEQHTGIAIDPQRMLLDAAYVDDVLTVCEARPDTELAELAQHFRLAQAETADAQGDSLPALGTSSGWAADTSGLGSGLPSDFGASQPPVAPSRFDLERQRVRAARKSPGWMSSGRWLGNER